MRNFNRVAKEIVSIIPKTEYQLLNAIDILIDDTKFTAPESTVPWDKMFNLLQLHMAQPRKMWEINVWSIFSEIPLQEIVEQMEQILSEFTNFSLSQEDETLSDEEYEILCADEQNGYFIFVP